MNLLLCAVAIALGAFVAASPSRAGRIWGSELLDKLSAAQKIWLLRSWRIFGILLCLGGMLFAIDNCASLYH